MAEKMNSDSQGRISMLTSGIYIVEHQSPVQNCHVVKNWLHQQEIPAEVEVKFLGESSTEDEDINNNLCNPVQYLLQMYRQANLSDKDRQTILTHQDQLVAIQLCMAQYNKQRFDDFDVDTSEVLQLARRLNNQKLNPSSSCSPASITKTQSTFDSVLELYGKFCQRCNVVDIMDVFNKVKAWLCDTSQDEDVRKKCLYAMLQWPKNELEVEIIKLLTNSTNFYKIHVDSTEGKSHVTCEENSLDKLTPKTCETGTSPSQTSATEALARQLFLSYLTLLVNSSDEISLARCMSLTVDDLNHDGFIALKNESRTKNMPMFQTAVSFVIQIRLGGHSYAPKADSPLAPHVKGLSDFINAVQKLQTIVEEVSDTRTAVMKVISSLRSSLTKCKGQSLRKSSLATVAKRLEKEMETLMGAWKGPLSESPPRKVDGGQGRIVYGLRTIRLLQGMLDREVGHSLITNPTQVLTDGFTSQKTPVRIPSVLSQFRSPEVIDPSSPEYQSLRNRLFSQKDPSTPAGPKRWQSDITWAKPAVTTGKDDEDDIDIFLSPAQRQQKQRSKGNSLWAISPEGQRTHPRLVCPNSEQVGLSSNYQSVRITDCSDTPKKGKTTTRNVPEASTLDQENMVNLNAAPVKLGGKSQKRKAKRTLCDDNESNSQASKKAKKSTKVTKKKVVPLGKGQKTLSHFFRV